MLGPPMFVCVNIFLVKILAEHDLGKALFDVTDKTALITSSGIGTFMATALFDAGANVIQVGRQRDRLEAVIAKRKSSDCY
jgi:hypothetical protein